jgi:hypothetical protein
MHFENILFALAVISLAVMSSVPVGSSDLESDNNNEKLEQLPPAALTNGLPTAGDLTEGFMAFTDLPQKFYERNGEQRNLDIGGGKYDASTEYLAGRNIINVVYDPYHRDETENEAALNATPYASVTLMSLLNVIDSKEEQLKVLNLAKTHLAVGGMLEIKIWQGDRSGFFRRQTRSAMRLRRHTSTWCVVFSPTLNKLAIFVSLL